MSRQCPYSSIACLMILSLSLIGCDSSNKYDNAYEAAWDGENAPTSIFASKEEIKGYQDGLEDSNAYEDGYFDGWNEKRPRYLNDQFYMEGFKDAKQDKKR